MKALLPSLETPEEIFSIGHGPLSVDVRYPDNYLKNSDYPEFNLRYDLGQEKAMGDEIIPRDEKDNDCNRWPLVMWQEHHGQRPGSRDWIHIYR